MTTFQNKASDAMAYELRWHIPGKVLLLTLSGDFTRENAKEVNEMIVSELGQSNSPISILIDAMNMNRPYNFSDIRDVQTYMDHHRLNDIYVATNDKLIKLAMMVIFNLSRAFLHISDDLDKANTLLNRRLTTLQ